LVIYQGSAKQAKGKGTVLFYHGFSGTKEKSVPYGTALAEAGFLTVCVDALGHGDRRYLDFESVFDDERWDAQFEATESETCGSSQAAQRKCPRSSTSYSNAAGRGRTGSASADGP
jgi:hypothetical protein